MLKVLIHWVYYYDSSWFSSFNARQKKNCVYFYDYDDLVWYVIDHLWYSQLQSLRLKIFQKYHDLIKFVKFWECDTNWKLFVWYKLDSPIIDISINDFAWLLDRSTRKMYFNYDTVKQSYSFKSNFINYCKLNVV